MLKRFEEVDRSDRCDNDDDGTHISGKTRVTYKLEYLTSVGSLCAHLRFSKKFGSDHIIFTQFENEGSNAVQSQPPYLSSTPVV